MMNSWIMSVVLLLLAVALTPLSIPVEAAPTLGSLHHKASRAGHSLEGSGILFQEKAKRTKKLLSIDKALHGAVPEAAKIEKKVVEVTGSVKEKKRPFGVAEDIANDNTDKPWLTFDDSNITMSDIVVAVPSMRRWQRDVSPAPENYLEPLLTKLWKEASPRVREHVHFIIMNVDRDPEKHEELLRVAYELPKSRVITKGKPFDLASKMATNDEGKIVLKKKDHDEEVSSTTMNWIAGETKDVPTLLTVASREAPYVLFLEDDVKPTTNALAKIMKYIHDSDMRQNSDWFMVDLYTPNISWRPVPATNLQKYDFECCTQAMLFRSSKIDDLIKYELEHPELPVDDNIRDLSQEDPKKFAIYSMVPNPFEHVGRFSSNPEKSYGVAEHQSMNFVA